MVTIEQLRLMKHMLGLDNRKKPYRNYGFFYEPQTDLENLVDKKLAYVRKVPEGYFYHLTGLGENLVLGVKNNE